MRLFVALDVPEGLREVVESVQESVSDLPLRFVKPKNVHLTLKFLGEVSEGKVRKLARELGLISFRPFALSTTRFGTFSSVWWLGVRLNEELAQLQRVVARACRPFALHDSRVYEPHLTLARFRELDSEQREALERVVLMRFSWKAERFILVRSELTRLGMVYTQSDNFLS